MALWQSYASVNQCNHDHPDHYFSANISKSLHCWIDMSISEGEVTTINTDGCWTDPVLYIFPFGSLNSIILVLTGGGWGGLVPQRIKGLLYQSPNAQNG